jgi:hypothetical protein
MKIWIIVANDDNLHFLSVITWRIIVKYGLLHNKYVERRSTYPIGAMEGNIALISACSQSHLLMIKFGKAVKTGLSDLGNWITT